MTGISTISSINSIHSSHESALQKANSIKNHIEGKASSENSITSFSDRLQASLNNVVDAQNNAAESVKDYELGREQNLAKVMIDQQVSSLGFQLTLNVRNKALAAYKEIMNMPV